MSNQLEQQLTGVPRTMLLLLVTLAVSGVYLFTIPFMSKKQEETNIFPENEPDLAQN